MIKFLMNICRFNFGEFEEAEFRKFLRMGAIFALVIGVYWTLRPLKDAIFIQLVDKLHIPYAKTVSVLALLPLVMFYTRLLEKTSKERMLVILPSFYGACILIFSGLMFFMQDPINADFMRTPSMSIVGQVVAYIWYLLVESFGSLVVALFWAFSSDITDPVSAKRGFPFIVAFGQLGGIILPLTIGTMPHRFKFDTDSLSMLILAGLTLSIIPLVKYFLRATPHRLLKAFHGTNEKAVESKQEPGFLEGLKLLLSHKYLICIFGVNFIYEFIITIFDFNFKIAAATQYSGVELSKYLSLYGSSVNVVSLACLLLGISNITRYLGVGVALAAMPIIVGAALFGFMTLDSLTFLFCLMVGSKAINYALNGPALKQLYIPTTPDVRFKAQAWIETFGSRASKEAGSIFNMMLSPLQKAFGTVAGKGHYLMVSGAIGFPLLAVWFGVALFLNKKYRYAISHDRVVC